MMSTRGPKAIPESGAPKDVEPLLAAERVPDNEVSSASAVPAPETGRASDRPPVKVPELSTRFWEPPAKQPPDRVTEWLAAQRRREVLPPLDMMQAAFLSHTLAEAAKPKPRHEDSGMWGGMPGGI